MLSISRNIAVENLFNLKQIDVQHSHVESFLLSGELDWVQNPTDNQY